MSVCFQNGHLSQLIAFEVMEYDIPRLTWMAEKSVKYISWLGFEFDEEY